MFSITILVNMSLFVAPLGQGPPYDRNLVTVDGNARIRFPAHAPRVRYVKNVIPLEGGRKMFMHIFSAETEKMSWLFSYNDYPLDTIVGADPLEQLERNLAGQMNGILNAFPGKPRALRRTITDTSRLPLPGRGQRFEIEKQNKSVRSELILARTRQYQILVIAESVDTPEINEFFSSWQLLRSPKPMTAGRTPEAKP